MKLVLQQQNPPKKKEKEKVAVAVAPAPAIKGRRRSRTEKNPCSVVKVLRSENCLDGVENCLAICPGPDPTKAGSMCTSSSEVYLCTNCEKAWKSCSHCISVAIAVSAGKKKQVSKATSGVVSVVGAPPTTATRVRSGSRSSESPSCDEDETFYDGEDHGEHKFLKVKVEEDREDSEGSNSDSSSLTGSGSSED